MRGGQTDVAGSRGERAEARKGEGEGEGLQGEGRRRRGEISRESRGEGAARPGGASHVGAVRSPPA